MSDSTKAKIVIFMSVLYFCCLFVRFNVSCKTNESTPSTQETVVTKNIIKPSQTIESVQIESDCGLFEEDSLLVQEEQFWKKCSEEYPIATEIWLEMKSYGWTDAACAGIMGNIMREVSGNTMEHISPNICNSTQSHYGLCQWSKKYYPDIQPKDGWAPSIAEQIEFLRYTIIHQRELYHNYGFTEEYLMTATDHREVAKVFCNGYERPGESSKCREDNAEKAWKYFVLGEEV